MILSGLPAREPFSKDTLTCLAALSVASSGYHPDTLSLGGRHGDGNA
jgi:hypothetical protein